ncbi:hypothetical protein Maq22A_c28060 [Methylobacterium aquaticum]|uniref:Uncharacterized protein n=1 Tax=Methylobacterium aquaticum TaxID=270351 RepID=A0A1Y0Z8Q5_9HYPH|nr:hypothetical protein Maq22A_c28060 [Methylobacterium aquaticum]
MPQRLMNDTSTALGKPDPVTKKVPNREETTLVTPEILPKRNRCADACHDRHAPASRNPRPVRPSPLTPRG